MVSFDVCQNLIRFATISCSLWIIMKSMVSNMNLLKNGGKLFWNIVWKYVSVVCIVDSTMKKHNWERINNNLIKMISEETHPNKKVLAPSLYLMHFQPSQL